MLNRILFARILIGIVALAISMAAAAAAETKKKVDCPLGLDNIEDLIRQAPSCRRAVAVFEACEFGASGDVSLGSAVSRKCEGDFLDKLSSAQRRTYQDKQKRCARKYENEDGTMYRSFEAFCGAYVARDYSAKFLKPAARGAR